MTVPFGIDHDETIRAVRDSVVVLYFGGRLQSEVLVEVDFLFAVVLMQTTIRRLQMEVSRRYDSHIVSVLDLKFHVLSVVPSFYVTIEVQDLPVGEIA